MNKLLALTLGLTLFIYSCASKINYTILNQHMSQHECSFATSYLKENSKKYGRNQKLVYYLDSAVIHMLCGNFRTSNTFLHKAETLAEGLWTKSITKEVGSFLLNDYTRPYTGEDFERVLINLLSAINYSLLENTDDALVEIRRLDSLLSLYNSKYEKKNIYKEDAFGRFLSGILYEAEGNLDDSFIDYFKSVQAYKNYFANYSTPIPKTLIEGLKRVAYAVNRVDEIKSIVPDNEQNILPYQKTKDLGRLIFINLNGKSPIKKENKLLIPSPSGPITLAFPKYVSSPPSCHASSFLVFQNGTQIDVPAELVEDIGKIAKKNLSDRKGRVIAKTIARAVAKQVALEAATSQIKDEAIKDLSKLLFNVINISIEKADTRTWRTLPNEIYLGSVFIEEGEYDLSVKMCGSEKKYFKKIKAQRGKTKFILFQTIY